MDKDAIVVDSSDLMPLLGCLSAIFRLNNSELPHAWHTLKTYHRKKGLSSLRMF